MGKKVKVARKEDLNFVHIRPVKGGFIVTAGTDSGSFEDEMVYAELEGVLQYLIYVFGGEK